MQPLLSQFGITRVARQTDLDRIGMPCFAAIRPNSRTLSSSQGKGLTDDAAMASAIMEAVEYAVAEQPDADSFRASADSLTACGIRWLHPGSFLPPDRPFALDAPLTWYYGHTVTARQPVAVPADLVRLNGDALDLKGICQTTNGLASGNTQDEAVFHGLCELVERDANTVWLLQSVAKRLASAIDPRSFGDRTLNGLLARVAGKGLEVRFFDQTSIAGLPVIMALIGDRTSGRKRFDVAAGYGAHPSAARAAVRALTEAAQTRITSIAGARDDIEAGAHATDMTAWADDMLAAIPRLVHLTKDAQTMFRSDLVPYVAERLSQAGLSEPIVVPLSRSDDFSVVRMLSSDLEDYEANLHWQPGVRAMQHLVLP